MAATLKMLARRGVTLRPARARMASAGGQGEGGAIDDWSLLRGDKRTREIARIPAWLVQRLKASGFVESAVKTDIYDITPKGLAAINQHNSLALIRPCHGPDNTGHTPRTHPRSSPGSLPATGFARLATKSICGEGPLSVRALLAARQFMADEARASLSDVVGVDWERIYS